MKNNEIAVINEKIDSLNTRKNLLVQKENLKARKLLNKQKIIAGGWLINQIKHYDPDKKFDVCKKILSTIPSYRKADILAVEELFKVDK